MRATRPTAALALLLPFLLAPALEAERVLWTAARGDAAIPANPTEMALSLELADDFEAWGAVERLTFDGEPCARCSEPAAASVALRFWAWQPPGAPGELQAELRFEPGDPHLKIEALRPGGISILLPTPFAARGRHFVSLQIEFQRLGAWSWWRAAGDPRLAPAWERSADGAWTPLDDGGPLETDLAFELATRPWDDADLARGCGSLEIESPPAVEGAIATRLVDVAALGADRAWAVGAAERPAGADPIAFERRGGRWQPLELPVPPGTELLAVEAISDDEIWLVGSRLVVAGPLGEFRQPLVLRYYPERAFFEMLPTPEFPDGDAVLADAVRGARGEVLLVGSAAQATPDGVRQEALILHWKETGFERLPVPGQVAALGEKLAAAAWDGNQLWAVGGRSSGGPGQNLLVVHWQGREVERVLVPGLDRVESLRSVAAQQGEVWLGGVAIDGKPVLVQGKDARWVAHASAVGGRALAAAPEKTFVTGGVGLASFVDFEWREEPGRELVVEGLSAPAPCALFAAGRFETSLGARAALYRLVPIGFSDGFESGGFEAWIAIGKAP